MGSRIEPEHEPGNTTVRFTELIGNGTQVDVPLSETFTGVWELRFADNPDGSGELTELHQSGAVVSGCIGFANVTGTVTGNVLRLNGVDTRDERPSVYLLATSPDGQLRGMESTRDGVFRARIGVVLDESTTTPRPLVIPHPFPRRVVVVRLVPARGDSSASGLQRRHVDPGTRCPALQALLGQLDALGPLQ